MLKPEIIGNRLKALRGNRSCKEVCDAIQISQSALSMYENGRRIPRDEIKCKFAEFYNTSIEAIFYAR